MAVISMVVLMILVNILAVSWTAARARAAVHHRRARAEAAARGGIRLGAALLERDPDLRGPEQRTVGGIALTVTLTDESITASCDGSVVEAAWTRGDDGRVHVKRWRDR